MSRFRFVVGLVLLAIVAGCNEFDDRAQVVEGRTPIDGIRPIAAGIAESGVLSSGVASIESEIYVLGQSDPAKADQLRPLYEALMAADGDKKAVKEKAQMLLDAL